ncbi:DUF3237 domain-containing protein [Pseudorhodoplanes sinuspersici]|uniref:UPF0311 protein CAK95_11420 n=1 Tax=Pseudorhodoplanes sinuspersici TaxID=1235591 RepID=A0A1W6ZQG5_9HYPH|nr:DUF3237 domain-containing protein [Pseudorhodoplanes sinuspersici]ARP99626.1 hypothetical protein CAK95_11420 [Pseudorhodoplanes sinuspersici]RKE70600.1 uncharacterized protein DUF3237 [Pseudorhodoplanes sinuspersici]
MDPVKPTLEFVFRIRMQLGIRQKFGPLPQGSTRGFVTAAGGTIEGPRLNGRVIPNSGGDWALYRDDHTVGFDARYMLEADDNTMIYMLNRGYRHAPPDTAARMEALDPSVDPSMYYMRVAPSFETPIGKHDWLTRTVIVGSARRNADHSIFDYYAVL